MCVDDVGPRDNIKVFCNVADIRLEDIPQMSIDPNSCAKSDAGLEGGQGAVVSRGEAGGVNAPAFLHVRIMRVPPCAGLVLGKLKDRSSTDSFGTPSGFMHSLGEAGEVNVAAFLHVRRTRALPCTGLVPGKLNNCSPTDSLGASSGPSILVAVVDTGE